MPANMSNKLVSQSTQHWLSFCAFYTGWLFGSGSGSGTTKKHSKARDLQPYQSPAERAETLKQDRAIDLAALLELKQLVQHQSVEFFKTWVEDGNPCDFAKVLHLCAVSCLAVVYTSQ